MKPFEPLMATIATFGLLVALVTGILYFMRLPIFGEVTLSWLFVTGLVGCATAIFAIAAKAYWGEPR